MNNTESKLVALRSDGLKKFLGGILGAILIFVLVGVISSNVSAKTSNLQDSVIIAQADYELSQAQTLAGMQQYCINWQELALAKVELAKATKIESNIDEAAVKAVDCKKVAVPSSFI